MAAHYFSENIEAPSQPKAFTYLYGGRTYCFTTDAGVFSVGKMDAGTDVLLRNMPPLSGSLLDLGCGFGCIGIVLAGAFGVRVTQADINPRAVFWARENAKKNSISTATVRSNGFENIGGVFDTIILNPPIHAGKDVIFPLYEGAFRHLVSGGRFFVVIKQKHGALSSKARLDEIFGNSHILYKKKGVYIFFSVK